MHRPEFAYPLRQILNCHPKACSMQSLVALVVVLYDELPLRQRLPLRESGETLRLGPALRTIHSITLLLLLLALMLLLLALLLLLAPLNLKLAQLNL